MKKHVAVSVAIAALVFGVAGERPNACFDTRGATCSRRGAGDPALVGPGTQGRPGGR